MILVLAAVVGTPFSYEGTLAPGRTLHVADVNGSIHVHGGDRLTIHAAKQADRGNPNAVTVRVDPVSDGLSVCVRYSGETDRRCDDRGSRYTTNNDDTRVDFDITVPRGVALEARTVNGSIEARTDGTISAATVNGTVAAEGADVTSVKSVNGSVRVRVLTGSRSPLVAKTVNGSIDVALPAGSGAEIAARTLTGDINAPGLTVQRPQFGPGARVDGRIGDGSRHITAETVNGAIVVTRQGEDRAPRRQSPTQPEGG